MKEPTRIAWWNVLYLALILAWCGGCWVLAFVMVRGIFRKLGAM